MGLRIAISLFPTPHSLLPTPNFINNNRVSNCPPYSLNSDKIILVQKVYFAQFLSACAKT